MSQIEKEKVSQVEGSSNDVPHNMSFKEGSRRKSQLRYSSKLSNSGTKNKDDVAPQQQPPKANPPPEQEASVVPRERRGTLNQTNVERVVPQTKIRRSQEQVGRQSSASRSRPTQLKRQSKDMKFSGPAPRDTKFGFGNVQAKHERNLSKSRQLLDQFAKSRKKIKSFDKQTRERFTPDQSYDYFGPQKQRAFGGADQSYNRPSRVGYGMPRVQSPVQSKIVDDGFNRPSRLGGYRKGPGQRMHSPTRYGIGRQDYTRLGQGLDYYSASYNITGRQFSPMRTGGFPGMEYGRPRHYGEGGGFGFRPQRIFSHERF